MGVFFEKENKGPSSTPSSPPPPRGDDHRLPDDEDDSRRCGGARPRVDPASTAVPSKEQVLSLLKLRLKNRLWGLVLRRLGRRDESKSSFTYSAAACVSRAASRRWDRTRAFPRAVRHGPRPAASLLSCRNRRSRARRRNAKHRTSTARSTSSGLSHGAKPDSSTLANCSRTAARPASPAYHSALAKPPPKRPKEKNESCSSPSSFGSSQGGACDRRGVRAGEAGVTPSAAKIAFRWSATSQSPASLHTATSSGLRRSILGVIGST
mmetsp:Transcript_8568/g.28078  ORF Transcript_8568/g.28078 Transcript_8568/m.28078 type:complete len:266 (-) Transcript_8568:93-890(-)